MANSLEYLEHLGYTGDASEFNVTPGMASGIVSGSYAGGCYGHVFTSKELKMIVIENAIESLKENGFENTKDAERWIKNNRAMNNLKQ